MNLNNDPVLLLTVCYLLLLSLCTYSGHACSHEEQDFITSSFGLDWLVKLTTISSPSPAATSLFWQFSLTGGKFVPHLKHLPISSHWTWATRCIISLITLIWNYGMNWQDLGESHDCLTLHSILTICQGLISLEILEMWVCRAVGRWNVYQASSNSEQSGARRVAGEKRQENRKRQRWRNFCRLVLADLLYIQLHIWSLK